MEWISVDKQLPECIFEMDDAWVSQSIEITDGEGVGRGHYRDDGEWVAYGAEHDFQIVDPYKITHWAAMPKLPK